VKPVFSPHNLAQEAHGKNPDKVINESRETPKRQRKLQRNVQRMLLPYPESMKPEKIQRKH
jgi:hypothetical protein